MSLRFSSKVSVSEAIEYRRRRSGRRRPDKDDDAIITT
jgi:hypothetical protein